MRLPLWSKVLGVVFGFLLSAGVAYAVVHYVYEVEAPGGVTIEEPPVGSTEAGLQISPTSLDFGTIERDYGPGSNRSGPPFIE